MSLRSSARGLALGLAGGLLLLVPAQPLASDGIGKMEVTPTGVSVASTGNTLTFTFTADAGALIGQSLLEIPVGWSPPQTSRSGETGFVRLDHGTCGGGTRIARIVGRQLVIATACSRTERFTLTYGPASAPKLAADGYVFLTQTKATAKPARTRAARRRVIPFRALPPSKQPVVRVLGGPPAKLLVAATSVATAGSPFDVSVRAIDSYGNTASGYLTKVSLSSTDPQATLPGPYAYTANDGGTHTFGGVVLRTLGAQRVTASDSSGLSGVSAPINVYPFATGN